MVDVPKRYFLYIKIYDHDCHSQWTASIVWCAVSHTLMEFGPIETDKYLNQIYTLYKISPRGKVWKRYDGRSHPKSHVRGTGVRA